MPLLDPKNEPPEDYDDLLELLEDEDPIDDQLTEADDEIGGRWFKSHGWARGTNVW